MLGDKQPPYRRLNAWYRPSEAGQQVGCDPNSALPSPNLTIFGASDKIKNRWPEKVQAPHAQKALYTFGMVAAMVAGSIVPWALSVLLRRRYRIVGFRISWKSWTGNRGNRNAFLGMDTVIGFQCQFGGSWPSEPVFPGGCWRSDWERPSIWGRAYRGDKRSRRQFPSGDRDCEFGGLVSFRVCDCRIRRQSSWTSRNLALGSWNLWRLYDVFHLCHGISRLNACKATLDCIGVWIGECFERSGRVYWGCMGCAALVDGMRPTGIRMRLATTGITMYSFCLTCWGCLGTRFCEPNWSSMSQ